MKNVAVEVAEATLRGVEILDGWLISDEAKRKLAAALINVAHNDRSTRTRIRATEVLAKIDALGWRNVLTRRRIEAMSPEPEPEPLSPEIAKKVLELMLGENDAVQDRPA